MHLDHLLYPRQTQTSSDGCVQCPTPAPCNCAANEQCFQISRSCTTCSSNKCVPNNSSSGSSSGGGVSKGAVAGAVVGSILFLAVVVVVFWWWRRRSVVPKQTEAPEVKDVPAPAETVLNRPDPMEKIQTSIPQPSREEAGTVRVYDTSSNSIIDLDPASRGASHSGDAASPYNSGRESVQSNPFGDGHSIQTTSTGTQSTNVIPIALVPPGSVTPVSPHSVASLQQQQVTRSPTRPERSPDMDLNMDHLNVSSDNVRSGDPSVLSGISGVSSRHSYMSGASYASDVLAEASTIVTQSQRQVFGVVKAEVVQAPGSSPSSPQSAASLRTASITSRPPVRSPLAATSFGPQDVLRESDEEQSLSVHGDPFGDEHSPLPSGYRSSAATFGTTTDGGSVWTPAAPNQPWASGGDGSNRPISVSTQAGSVIGADIRDATRVHLGFVQPTSASYIPATPISSSGISTSRSAYRMTSGRLVSPPTSGGRIDPLQSQQERAYADVQAAKAQNIDRSSMSTMASGTSTRADSILESFTFVPPSPISNRPIRTPPRSPLAQNAYQSTQANGGETASNETDARSESPLQPPNRRQLALSTGSQMSAMSTGLGSFPFQIDSGTNQPEGVQNTSSEAASSVSGRQRASLDTLALTSDLSSYPLGFDRRSKDSFAFSTKS